MFIVIRAKIIKNSIQNFGLSGIDLNMVYYGFTKRVFFNISNFLTSTIKTDNRVRYDRLAQTHSL
jgi:hypothetical protein